MSDNEHIEFIASQIVDSAIKIHKYLGPGLLEKVYETCLEHELKKRGLTVQRQLIIPIEYDSLCLEEGFRLDLLVENKVIVELKAIEETLPIHEAQLLTYMKVLKKPQGLLINFFSKNITKSMKPFVNEYFNMLPD